MGHKADPWPWSLRKKYHEPLSVLDRVLDSPLRAIIYYLYAIILYLRGSPFKPPRNKAPIKVVCISDTHNQTVDLPPGDLLIHAGDTAKDGTVREIQAQIDWLDRQPHKHKVLVAGNHDSYFDPKSRPAADKTSGAKPSLKSVRYLENEGVELKFKRGRKLKIWGAPDIPVCGGPDFAFQYSKESPPWKDRIPIDTDILVTHTPPAYHRDLLRLGCPSLLQETWRVKPRLHVCGHWHSDHGRESIFWDDGQRAYESLMARNKGGILQDIFPSRSWFDALMVLWCGVRGVVWQRLMVGPGGANGGILINAALLRFATNDLSYTIEVVEL